MDLHQCKKATKQSDIIEYKNCCQHNMEYKFKNGKIKKKKKRKGDKEDDDEVVEKIEDRHDGGAPILEFAFEKG